VEDSNATFHQQSNNESRTDGDFPSLSALSFLQCTDTIGWLIEGHQRKTKTANKAEEEKHSRHEYCYINQGSYRQ